MGCVIVAISNSSNYVAKELKKMYSDSVNSLYFTFLSPILSEFNAINLLFQKEQTDHLLILEQLEHFTLSMLRRVLYSSAVRLNVDLNFESIVLPIEKVDFGYQFAILLKKMIKDKNIADGAIKDLKIRFQSFLIRPVRNF